MILINVTENTVGTVTSMEITLMLISDIYNKINKQIE